MRPIKGIPLKLQVILCTFIEVQLQELEPKRCEISWIGLGEKTRHCEQYSSYWAAKYTILDQMQKWKIWNKFGIDWARINVQTIYRLKYNYISFPMHFTELDLEFSKRSYDQFIIACLGLRIQTTPLIIQLHLFVLCQVYQCVR